MPAIEVFYDVAMRRLDAQMQQVDQLDTKVATLIASASAIIAIFAGLLAVGALPSNHWVAVASVILLGLASLVYLALIALLYKAYQVSRWNFRPDLERLKANCESNDEQSVQKWVANECVRSVVTNEPKIKQKTRWLYWALFAFILEAVFLISAGGVTLLGK